MTILVTSFLTIKKDKEVQSRHREKQNVWKVVNKEESEIGRARKSKATPKLKRCEIINIWRLNVILHIILVFVCVIFSYFKITLSFPSVEILLL